MDIVIITGCPHSGWETALPTLRQSGLEGTGERFDEWYDGLFQKAGISDLLELDHSFQTDHGIAEDARTLLSEQADAPLLLADSRNLWLLEFWVATFPRAKFLLLHTRLENALAYTLQQGTEPEMFIPAWCSSNRQLMRFQRSHRDRSLLLAAESIVQFPEALAVAGQRIGLTLRAVNSSPPPVAAAPALERLLARQFIYEQPTIDPLPMELEANSQPLGDALVPASPVIPELYADYQQRQAQTTQLSKARDEQARLANERQIQVEQLTKARDEQAKLAAELKAQLETANLAQTEQVKCANEGQTQLTEARQARQKLEAANKEHEQENELLLLQLHQVQEELEHYYIQYQELTQESKEEPQALSNDSAGPQKSGGSSSVEQQGITAALQALVKPFRRTNKTQKKEKQQVNLLRESRLFDEAWYLTEYPDVAEAGINPIAHYLRYGAAEGRNPSLNFDTALYLAANPDVAAANINPLLHYIRYGRAEGRPPRGYGV